MSYLLLAWHYWILSWKIFPAVMVVFWMLFYFIEVKKWLPEWVGLPLDMACNFYYFTQIFLMPPDILHNPRQWTFSKRLQAYYYLQKWRGQIARFICNTFLEPYLPGHCKK